MKFFKFLFIFTLLTSISTFRVQSAEYPYNANAPIIIDVELGNNDNESRANSLGQFLSGAMSGAWFGFINHLEKNAKTEKEKQLLWYSKLIQYSFFGYSMLTSFDKNGIRGLLSKGLGTGAGYGISRTLLLAARD